MPATIRLLAPWLGLLALGLLGCGSDDDGPGPTGNTPPDAVQFARDVLPLFDLSCDGCHSPTSPFPPMDLSPDAAYASLVGVESTGYAPLLRVDPGEPDDSVLYLKLTGDPRTGQQMPAAGNAVFTDEELETIRAWITAGARDD